EQRRPEDLLPGKTSVPDPAVLVELLAVVRDDDQDRVLEEPFRVHPVDERTELVVGEEDLRVVVCRVALGLVAPALLTGAETDPLPRVRDAPSPRRRRRVRGVHL